MGKVVEAPAHRDSHVCGVKILAWEKEINDTSSHAFLRSRSKAILLFEVDAIPWYLNEEN